MKKFTQLQFAKAMGVAMVLYERRVKQELDGKNDGYIKERAKYMLDVLKGFGSDILNILDGKLKITDTAGNDLFNNDGQRNT